MPVVDSQEHETEPLSDFAKLHLDLAKSEVRTGSYHLQRGLFWTVLSLVLAVCGVLGLMAAMFLWLRQQWGAAPAALCVGAGSLVASAGLYALSRRAWAGASSFTLPRTREMLGEFKAWHQNPPNS